MTSSRTSALATPLVLSVHSVVSWDFAMALLPGWHSTLFAPFFVDGAILSGFAMVLVLVLPMISGQAVVGVLELLLLRVPDAEQEQILHEIVLLFAPRLEALLRPGGAPDTVALAETEARA